MSCISWAGPPTPILAAEAFPRLPAAVIAVQPHDRGTLRTSVCPDKGLTAAFRTQTLSPAASLNMSLIEAIQASGVIYSLRAARVAGNFCSGAKVEALSAGTFKSSGTNASVLRLHAAKPVDIPLAARRDRQLA